MPPGSRYLAPIKLLIARTLGRSRTFKTKFIPWAFQRIFPQHFFEGVIETYQPQLVFLSNLYSWFDIALLGECRERHIPSIGMVANWDHIDKYFIPFQADYFLAQSEQVKHGAIREQEYPEERIVVTGYPYFDYVYKKEYLMPREEFLSRWSFPPDAKVILYISGSSYCPDEPEVIEELLGECDRGRFGKEVRVIIRPYLGGRFQDKDFDERKFNSFERHPRVRMYRRESWSDVSETLFYLNIMNHADLVMSAFSTAALEVSLFDRPMIGIGFDGHHHRPFHRSVRRFETFTHFQDVFRTGAMRVVRNFPEFFRAISGYLEKPGLDSEKRARMRETMCYRLDGKASERIVECLLGEL
jgi:CDP-glycerol glycerophosphotransferase (TagB/SpsB family)